MATTIVQHLQPHAFYLHKCFFTSTHINARLMINMVLRSCSVYSWANCNLHCTSGQLSIVTVSLAEPHAHSAHTLCPISVDGKIDQEYSDISKENHTVHSKFGCSFAAQHFETRVGIDCRFSVAVASVTLTWLLRSRRGVSHLVRDVFIFLKI